MERPTRTKTRGARRTAQRIRRPIRFFSACRCWAYAQGSSLGESGVSPWGRDGGVGEEDLELLAEDGERKGSSRTSSLREVSDGMVGDDEEVEAVRAARGSGEGGGVNMAWREGIGVKEREGKGRTEDRTRTRKSRSLRPLSDAPFFGRMGLGGAVSAGTGDRCCKSVRSGPLEGERGGGEIEKEKRTRVAIRAGVSGGHERTVTAEAERAWRAEGVVLALRARRGRWKTERTESGTRQGSSPRDQWPCPSRRPRSKAKSSFRHPRPLVPHHVSVRWSPTANHRPALTAGASVRSTSLATPASASHAPATPTTDSYLMRAESRTASSQTSNIHS